MASNFHITSYKFEDSLYLRLNGDFDESSADELINTITKNGTGSMDIFIDTNNLKTILPFNRDVFKKNFNRIKKTLKKPIIIGVNKYKFEQGLD